MSQNPPRTDNNGKVSFHDHHGMLMDAPIGIYIATPEGRFLAANPAMALMAGYETPEEMVESVKDIAKQISAHPAEREAFMGLVEDLGAVGSREFQMPRRDGSMIWVSRSGRGVRDQNGKIIQYQGFIIDITERKLAEKALKENEARLRGITDSTLDAIVMIDHQGAISFWNPAAETIFGYRADEAIGQDLHYLLAPQKYHEAYQKAFPGFQRTGKGRAIGGTLELVARRKDGQERRLPLSFSPVAQRQMACRGRCPRHHGTQADGTGAEESPSQLAAVPEDGIPGHPGRGRGPRLQQPASGHGRKHSVFIDEQA